VISARVDMARGHFRNSYYFKYALVGKE